MSNAEFGIRNAELEDGGRIISAPTDYISREAAKKKHCEICMEECICYRSKSTCDELKAFDLIHAADVWHVVLCRDCEYSYDSVGGWCCSHGICVDCIVREDFFCADGVKREES